ncbi:MAG TPA: hypothetical protein PLK04_11550, partial [Bacillota bacterium]|nr:hypothetical protein [Bacillota bacterium]
MIQFKKDTTFYDLAFILYDATDHITPKTGLSPTVQISKNGATTFSTAAGTVSEIGYGFYRWSPASSDVDTLGRLAIRITATGADPLAMIAQVVAYDPYAATNLGLSNLDTTV